MRPVRRQLTPAVVLVADRTLSADYKVLFEGIFGTIQTTRVPAWAMRRFFAPPVRTDRAGRAVAAPLGLRRVESALLAATSLGPEDVVCATPESLPGLLGPWTRIVAVSSSDPLGAGMSNSTTTQFLPGTLYTRRWTEQMMTALARAKRRWGFALLVGGGGAWQWRCHPARARRWGVDVVFEGFFESVGPGLFEELLSGRDVPPLVSHPDSAAEAIRPIRAATLMGVVELSRGCGNGCGFCTMARTPMAHLPAELVLADVQTNLAAGITAVVNSSEDFFRYGGRGGKVNFQALRELLVQMRHLQGLSFMQLAHGNVSSVVQFTEDQLRELRRLLSWARPTEYLWVNLGIESASGQLLRQHAPAKFGNHRPEDWAEMVLLSADRLIAAGFFPVFSVILGLPGETGRDVARTLALVRRLHDRPAVVFPVFYEPLGWGRPEEGRRFDLGRMSPEHLELFRTCYEVNFKLVPRLYWDNQRAGGVSWLKRVLGQLLGRLEVFAWRRRLVRLERQILRRHPAGAGKILAAKPREDTCRA